MLSSTQRDTFPSALLRPHFVSCDWPQPFLTPGLRPSCSTTLYHGTFSLVLSPIVKSGGHYHISFNHSLLTARLEIQIKAESEQDGPRRGIEDWQDSKPYCDHPWPSPIAFTSRI